MGKGVDVQAPDPRLIDAQIKSLGIQDQAIQHMIETSRDMAPQQRQMMQDSIDRSRTLWQQSQEDREFALGKRAQLSGIQNAIVRDANAFNTEDRRAELAGKAPVHMIAVSKAAFDRNGKPNRHAGHDVGLAVENLLLQAVSMGLFAHPMAGFDAAKVRETYGVPEGHDPLVAIAAGYPGDPEALPDDLKEREMEPRERKPLGQFVFGSSWGASWGGLES